ARRGRARDTRSLLLSWRNRYHRAAMTDSCTCDSLSPTVAFPLLVEEAASARQSAPSPLVGEGWGGGSWYPTAVLTPLPARTLRAQADLPHQGGGNQRQPTGKSEIACKEAAA